MKVLVLILMMSFTSMGSDRKGNGGGAHVCSDKVEMYDLTEGRLRYSHVPADFSHLDSSAVIKELVDKIAKYNSWLGAQTAKKLEYLKTNLQKLPSISLLRVKDAEILLTEKNCKYEQLANWDNATGRILVDAELFNKMNAVNKAALYIHEALYKIARENGAKNSDKVRRVVSEVFSDRAVSTELFKGLTKKSKNAYKISCNLDAVVVESRNGKVYNVYKGKKGVEKMTSSFSLMFEDMNFLVSPKERKVNIASYGASSRGGYNTYDYSVKVEFKDDSWYGAGTPMLTFVGKVDANGKADEKSVSVPLEFAMRKNFSLLNLVGDDALLIYKYQNTERKLFDLSISCKKI